MENEDPFSSFIIHPNSKPMFEVKNPDNYCSDQIENSSTINNASTREKLKSRRKENGYASEILKYLTFFFHSFCIKFSFFSDMRKPIFFSKSIKFILAHII
jgi:hypothetical protein